MALVIGSALLGPLPMRAAGAFPPLNEPPTPDRLPGKFIWVDLFTTDPMAATRFYEGMFGWAATTFSRAGRTYVLLTFGGASVAEHVIRFLNPPGLVLGLNGVILAAYIVAIPANEIVIPTVLMLTVLTTKTAGVGHGAGVLFEINSATELLTLLHSGGWTLLTAVNVMLFSLAHNPCSTTIYTIYRETRSRKSTLIAVFLPLAIGFALTFAVAQTWRLLASI